MSVSHACSITNDQGWVMIMARVAATDRARVSVEVRGG